MSFDWSTISSVFDFAQPASWAKFKTEPNINKSKLIPLKKTVYALWYLFQCLWSEPFPAQLICFCFWWLVTMAIPVMEFQVLGYKIRKIFPQNLHIKRKLLNFKNCCSWEVSKSAKIWHSKSIFYVKNHRNLSQFFIEEYQFRITFFYWHFLITSISK